MNFDSMLLNVMNGWTSKSRHALMLLRVCALSAVPRMFCLVLSSFWCMNTYPSRRIEDRLHELGYTDVLNLMSVPDFARGIPLLHQLPDVRRPRPLTERSTLSSLF
jgi:hypothetical protein